jgi:hypothetical protein
MARAREIALVNHLPREVSMKGRIQSRRAKWIRVAFAVAVAIAAHALNSGSAQAATKASPTNTVLAGFTAQRFPVFFKVSSDGKVLLSEGIAISMTCTSGTTLVWHDTFGRVSIHPNGRLDAHYASPTILAGGTAESIKDALAARLNPKHSQLTGTWQLAANFSFADGTSDQCDSGPVRFTATT